MSLTPITQYVSTASINPRVASSPRIVQSPKAPARSLGGGEVVQANGLSQTSNADAKTSLNVSYDHLARQTDIGPGANTNSSLQTYLASYEQNSGSEASSQSSGSLFKSSA